MEENFYPIGHYGLIGKKIPIIESYLVSGAVQKPTNYELIWDNKGSFSDSKISVWKPIPASGYVALGVVVMSNFEKPSLDLIRCVSGEYTNQLDLGYSLWDNEGTDDKDSLSFWDIPGIPLILSVNSLFKPNSFDYPVFNISDNELDYKDKIFLGRHDNTIESGEEASFSIKKVNIDISNIEQLKTISKYLKKVNRNIEDGQEKIKYKSDKNKCLGIDNAYWSDIHNTINMDNMVSEEDDSEISELSENVKLMECKDADYIGTNWIKYPDTSIRLSDKNDHCLTANIGDVEEININGSQVTEKDVIYTRPTGTNKELDSSSVSDTNKNILTLKKCRDDLKGQKFEVYNNKILYSGDYLGEVEGCVTSRNLFGDNYVRLEECVDNDKNQQWEFNNLGTNGCIEIDSIVYVPYLQSRGEKNWNAKMSDNNIEDTDMAIAEDTYDPDKYHIYVKGQIISDNSNYWKVKLMNGLGYKYEKKSSPEMILDVLPNTKSLILGTKVICKNKELSISGFTENNIKWYGVIAKKINKFRYLVIFTKNSVELDSNRDSLGRPRSLDIREIKRVNIRLMKSAKPCESNKDTRQD